MKRLLVLFTLPLLLAGCLVTSKQPFGNNADQKIVEELKGTWESIEEDSQENGYLLILGGEQTGLVMIAIDSAYQFDDGYVGYATSIGEYTFLNLQPFFLEKGVMKTEQEDGYIIVYCKIKQNILQMHLLNNEFFQKAVKEGKLKGTIDDEFKMTQLDDSPENISEFIKNNKIENIIAKDIFLSCKKK